MEKHSHVHEHEHNHESCHCHEHEHCHEHGHEHEHEEHIGCSCGHCHGHGGGDEKGELITLIIGTVIFIIGLLVPDSAKLYVFLAAYIILAYEILINTVKSLFSGHLFDENALMAIASIGAFAIGNYSEAVAVVLLYQIGEILQDKAVEKSRKSITSLMDIRPDYANVKRDGKVIKVSPEEVKIGEEILINPGEKVPLDGTVVSGEAFVDTKALTGESVLAKVSSGVQVLSGSLNTDSPITIAVEKEFKESAVSKILDMVQNAQSKKSPAERFITKFAKYYTPIVVALAALVMLIPSVITHDYRTWIYRGLLFLVVSCPCALVISVPLGFFTGIGCSSKNGVLIKGSGYLEMLSKLDSVVFDKTGTLTKGEFAVSKINSTIEESEFLELAAYGEYYSHHPIAVSIKTKYGKEIDESKIKNYKEISGKGIQAEIDGKQILLGNRKLIDGAPDEAVFGTVIYMSIDGTYAGYILIEDTVKPDSKQAISELEKMNIKTAMLSGDNKAAVEKIGSELGISNVHSQLLPQDKVRIVDDMMKRKAPKSSVAFVGDGINDAPVLVSADLGIAMGGIGSDSAIEAADVVIMTDEPSKIVTAVKIAKHTMNIITQNIVFAIAVKVLIMILSTLGLTTMWIAIFGDVGVALIAILNSLRALKVK